MYQLNKKTSLEEIWPTSGQVPVDFEPGTLASGVKIG